MPYVVDFKDVSTVGLESSSVADALAGLRANEARYDSNKHGHAFTVSTAAEVPDVVDRVSRILRNERDVVIGSPSKPPPSRSTDYGWTTSSTSRGCPSTSCSASFFVIKGDY